MKSTSPYPALFQHVVARIVWPILAITIFVVMLAVCVIVSDVTDLCDPFYLCDVSDYGFVDRPEHKWFVSCFVLTPMMLCIGVYLRHCQLQHEVPMRRCIGWCAPLLLVIAFLSWMALIVMAVENGKRGQLIHLPAALIGIGLLAVYDIGHAVLSSCILCSTWREGKAKYTTLRVVTAVLYIGTPITSIIMVISWIVLVDSRYEWIAVAMLVLHFLPMSVELALDLHAKERDSEANSKVPHGQNPPLKPFEAASGIHRMGP